MRRLPSLAVAALLAAAIAPATAAAQPREPYPGLDAYVERALRT